MKILHISYTGDFPEAYERLYIKNGKENYYGQKYSVGVVIDQARKGDEVLILVVKSNIETSGYRVKLEDNLEAMALDTSIQDFKVCRKKIEEAVKEFAPDCVLLRFPDVRLLRFFRKNHIPVFPVFFDSFEYNRGGIKAKLAKYWLYYELQHPSVRWVANHQINAARSISNLGVNPNKILPFDWEHDDSPSNWNKTIPADLDTKTINVFYAGAVVEDKGVLDLIESAKYVMDAGRTIQIRIAGKIIDNRCEDFAKQLGVDHCVEFLGLTDHDKVLSYMNAADVVVVPSHHSYPEGLPMTIMESLMVHTPVIVSDHPMFVGRLGKRGAVRFFHEKDASALAEVILSTCSSVEAYQNRSINAPLEWQDICLDLKWGDMINLWTSDPLHCDFSDKTLDKILLQ
jgi:glycosyltransferase involved in cell wall biosynthesis